MSRPRFLIDHNVPDAIWKGLRRMDATIETICLRDLGMISTPDPDVLEYAAQQQWLLVTLDVNSMTGFAYQRIVAGLRMPGLFILKDMQPPFRRYIYDLFSILFCSEFEDWADKVEYLPW